MTVKIKNILKKEGLPADRRGFTLIETLVAVMILATAVAGPLSIASRALNNSVVAKDQITAFYLAQDAIEYARFARDGNTLKGADWITGAGGSSSGIDLTPCQSANGCYVDTTGNSYTDGNGYNPSVPVSCSGGCPGLYYDSANSFYTYNTSGTSKSLFTRTILFTNTSSTEQKITVTVSWQDLGGTTRQVQVFENIFAWQG